MRLVLRQLPILGLALLAVACAPAGPPRRFGAPAALGPRAALFVSPAGEPFRAVPGAPPPLAAWFAAADANRDGALSFAEFEADFQRWFGQLDADHDGEIAPAEVTRYETEILPEIASYRPGLGYGGGRRGGGMARPRPGGRGGMGGRRPGRMGGGAGGGMGGGLPGGAARFGLLAIPHPIMSADEDFNRGVSRAEFDRAAATRFNLLDEAHDGRLTLPALTARRQRMAGERRGRRRPSDS